MRHKEGVIELKKGQNKFIISALIAAIYSIIVFVVPVTKSSAFWVSYGFTLIAIIMQIVIWKKEIENEENKKNRFLNISTVQIGGIYFAIQILSSVVFFVVPSLEIWISIVTNILILGITLVIIFADESAKNEIERVEENIKSNVNFIRLNQCEVELLADAEEDAKVKEELQKLAEKIRFSDPMSNDVVKPIEEKIIKKIEELKIENSKLELIKELETLLNERNKKIKMMK